MGKGEEGLWIRGSVVPSAIHEGFGFGGMGFSAGGKGEEGFWIRGNPVGSRGASMVISQGFLGSCISIR